jgi:hypothetical protein
VLAHLRGLPIIPDACPCWEWTWTPGIERACAFERTLLHRLATEGLVPDDEGRCPLLGACKLICLIEGGGTKMKIELKENNCITNDPCIICGERCDPMGLDFFKAGTQSLVCDECAGSHAPELMRIRGAALEYCRASQPQMDEA